MKKQLLNGLFIIFFVFLIFPLAGWFWGITIEQNDGTVSMSTSKLTMNCGDTLSRDTEGIKYSSGWIHNDSVRMYLSDTSERLGVGTNSPDSFVEFLYSAGPQLRLTHTDNVDYVRFQVDTQGDLNLTASGSKIVFNDHIYAPNKDIDGINNQNPYGYINNTGTEPLAFICDSERTTTAGDWVKLKEIKLNRVPNSTLKVYYQFRCDPTTSSSFAHARVYRNGVAKGADNSTNGDWVSITETLSGWGDGNTLELWGMETSGGSLYHVDVRRFRILCTRNIEATIN